MALGQRNFLVTLHSATLGKVPDEEALEALLAALDGHPEARLFFTHANADAKGRAINERIGRYVAGQAGRAGAFPSLGRTRYLSLLACADLVIGNSSSGLIEAPLLRTPTVNIGPRQDGRLRAPSVIDCGEDAASIRAAIENALSPAHREIAGRGESPYGQGDSSARIKDVLKQHPLPGLIVKRFQDLT
jgi:UDP-hydrolysing UDP-N-acetyl-D-glucosamine 2-epimerase